MLAGRKTKYCKDSNSTFIYRSNAKFIENPPSSPFKIPTQSKVSINQKEHSNFSILKRSSAQKGKPVLSNCKAHLRTMRTVCFGAVTSH